MENFLSFDTKKTQSSSGFSTLFLLAFLPLALTLLYAMMAALAATQLTLIPRQICRTENLKIQEYSAKTLRSLEQTSTPVRALRLQKVAAQTALAAALAVGQPVAVAKATQWLKTVHASQSSLHRYQKSLLFLQSTEILRMQNAMHSNINLEFQKLAEKLNFFLTIKLSSIQIPKHRLAIKPDIISDEPAVYEPVHDFSVQQSSQAFWRMTAQAQKHHWLAGEISALAQWSDSCEASLFKQDSDWKADLWRKGKGAKYYWNRFSSSSF
jgi:hypothetical protein